MPDGLAGMRLDAGLARLLGMSRSVVGQLVAAGKVRLDGELVVKSTPLVAGALLEVEIPAPRSVAVVPQDVPGFGIIYLDDDLVVVDKPVGVAAHPGPGWSGPTVLGALAAQHISVATSGAAERQGIVQRLDVGTTGLMVVARSESAYSILKDAFRYRRVDKTYHALVQGFPDPHEGTIDAPIGRHPSSDWKFAVTADGRDSVTHYELLEAFRSASLVQVHLETGRTHQIRVHFAAIGHPCAGDPLYGADPVLAARLGLQRQWLHARQLAFVHPGTGSQVSFESPYPADLAHALEVLRDGS